MADTTNIIPHANEINKQAETMRKAMKAAVFEKLKAFVESKTQETITYINTRIQEKIRHDPNTDYVLIKNIDVFNAWEHNKSFTAEELLEYKNGYHVLAGNYEPETLSIYKYCGQFTQTKNSLVMDVLNKVFEQYHKQGYRTQWCWNSGGSSSVDCFDIIWR
jgi:hypothetical protein